MNVNNKKNKKKSLLINNDKIEELELEFKKIQETKNNKIDLNEELEKELDFIKNTGEKIEHKEEINNKNNKKDIKKKKTTEIINQSGDANKIINDTKKKIINDNVSYYNIDILHP